MSLRSTLSPLIPSPLPENVSTSLDKEDLFGDFSEEDSPEVLHNENTINTDPVNYVESINDILEEDVDTIVSKKLQEIIEKVCEFDKQSKETNTGNVKRKYFTRSNFVEVKLDVNDKSLPKDQSSSSKTTNEIGNEIGASLETSTKTTMKDTDNVFNAVLNKDKTNSKVKDSRTMNNETKMFPLKDDSEATKDRQNLSTKSLDKKKIESPKKNTISKTTDIFKTILNNTEEKSLPEICNKAVKESSNEKLKHRAINESVTVDTSNGSLENNSEPPSSFSEITEDSTKQETLTKVTSSPRVVLVDVQKKSKHESCSNSSSTKSFDNHGKCVVVGEDDSTSSCSNEKPPPSQAKQHDNIVSSLTTTPSTHSNTTTNSSLGNSSSIPWNLGNVIQENSEKKKSQTKHSDFDKKPPSQTSITKKPFKSTVPSQSHTLNNVKMSSNTSQSNSAKKYPSSEKSSKVSLNNVAKNKSLLSSSSSSTVTQKSPLRGTQECPSNTTTRKKINKNSSLFVDEEDLRPPGVDDDEDEDIVIIPNDVSPISSPVPPIPSPIVSTAPSTSNSTSTENSSSITGRHERISNETISRISLGSPQPTLSPLPPPNFRIRSSVVHASHTSHVSTVQRYPSSLHNRQSNSNRPNSAKKHVTFSNADKIRDIRRKTHSPGMSISPPMSPIPPSPRRNVLTPLISPLPVTPLPESISPLPPSPKIMSPPLIRGSAILHSENSSVRMPVPIPRKRASVTQSIDFDKRPKFSRECSSIQKQPTKDNDDSPACACDNSPSAFTKQATCLRKSEVDVSVAVKMVKGCKVTPPEARKPTDQSGDVDLNENETVPLCIIVPGGDDGDQPTSSVGRCYTNEHHINRSSVKRKSTATSKSKNIDNPCNEQTRNNKALNETKISLKSDSSKRNTSPSAIDDGLTKNRDSKRIKKELSSSGIKLSKEFSGSSKVTSFSSSTFKPPASKLIDKTSGKNKSSDTVNKSSEIKNEKKLLQKDNDKQVADNTSNTKQSSPSANPPVKKSSTNKEKTDQSDLLNRDSGMSEKFYVLKCVELLQAKKVNTNTLIVSFTKRGNVSSWKCLMTSLVELSKHCNYSLLEKDIYVEEKNGKKRKTNLTNVSGLQNVCRIPLLTKAEAKWMKIINGVLQTHIFRKGPVELLDEIQTLLFKDFHMKPPQQESLW